MKHFLLAATLFSLASCSTSWRDLFKDDNPDKRNKKLMESFGAEEEVFEKFTENPEKKEEVAKNSEADSLKASASKSASAAKAPKAKAKTKTPSVPARTAPSPVVVPEKPAAVDKERRPEYPEDYPEEMKRIGADAKKVWAEYQPVFRIGETVVMDINYMGISTGKIVLKTEEETVIGEQAAWRVSANVKTSSYYRYLYELDDSIDSYISKDSLTPLKYSLIQRESGQDIDDLQLFDLEKLQTYSFYQRVKDGETKKRKVEAPIPTFFTDPLYVIWFMRGLPMEKGKTYTIPIMNKGKVIMLRSENMGIEKIKTKLGGKNAYRIKASTAYTGETLKSGDMTFWFSADETRTFLKFNAKIKIGSISGDVEKIVP